MENSNKKPDRRTIKTKKSIRNAFACLLNEKNISSITIKEIADKADINRKTFYNYYAGTWQIVNEIEDELISSLNNLLANFNFSKDMNNSYFLFEKLTSLINSDFDFYSHLMNVEINTSLIMKMMNTIRKNMMNALSEKINIDNDLLDTSIDYITAGMLSVYQHWFNSNRQKSIEEISKTVSILVSEGLNGVIKNSE